MAQELCGCCAQAAQQPQLQIDHHSYACSAQDFFQSTLLLRVTYIMSHPAFNYHDGLRCTEHWPRLCRKSKSHHEWNVHSLVQEYDRSHARLMGLMPRYEREAKKYRILSSRIDPACIEAMSTGPVCLSISNPGEGGFDCGCADHLMSSFMEWELKFEKLESEFKFWQSKVAEIPGQIRKEQETLLDIERDERERENVRVRAEHGIGAAERPLSDSELRALIQ